MPQTKYQRVRDHLTARIDAMVVGDQLPSEAELCTDYGVSRITVRRAVDDLVRAGVLVRQQGSGTFVSRPRYRSEFHESFSHSVMGHFRQQSALGNVVRSVVLLNEVAHDADAAEVLGLTGADPLIRLERLRYVNGRLHQHILAWLSVDRFPDVLDHDLSTGGLFDFLMDTYGVELVRNELLIRIDAAPAGIAEAIGVAVGEKVLVLESTVFDADDVPVTHSVVHHAAAHGEISISLAPPNSDSGGA